MQGAPDLGPAAVQSPTASSLLSKKAEGKLKRLNKGRMKELFAAPRTFITSNAHFARYFVSLCEELDERDVHGKPRLAEPSLSMCASCGTEFSTATGTARA